MFSLSSNFFVVFTMILASFAPLMAQLNPNYYEKLCPQALPTIKTVVERAIAREPRMGASLLRLHFHDCFVNGCDGSILLDDTPTFIGEKTATPNNNSVRGFDVIDQIKAAVDKACHGNIVSCADILAVAAHDSVVALGGRSYKVQVGRRDALTASRTAANQNIPSPLSNFNSLLSNFQSHGLSLKDLILLSGAHTIGFARCLTFRSRIYNETKAIDASFASAVRTRCPPVGGDNNLSPLDSSAKIFDTVYFKNLVQKKGLLHSDQQLFKGDGSQADELVKYYSKNGGDFWTDFGVSMLRMGNLSPLTGTNGEIRKNCRKVNS
ncbi:peroxidase P7-like [Dendrobium catenatum]|uniref:Peroxidase n=1 Tax=Dendrobium catenatum TaxID=906689 RepID=A0A2I0WA07_9ASPA|nr:peroxidase P7-like [Dendrobium catenatum]PKU72488.1 Cationic peroxidase 1 [Dendrobium catenatum]